MEEIAISEFKAKCLALLEQVRATKKPIRITRFGKPVAEVVPPTTVEDRKAWIGSMKGWVWVSWRNRNDQVNAEPGRSPS